MCKYTIYLIDGRRKYPISACRTRRITSTVWISGDRCEIRYTRELDANSSSRAYDYGQDSRPQGLYT